MAIKPLTELTDRGKNTALFPKAMAKIHCFGAGLVGSYVIRYLADKGHEVHAYDQQPYRVEGLPGVEVHYVEHDEYPHELIQGSVTDSFIINMLPGSIGHVCTTLLAERPCALVDLSFSKFTPDRDDQKARDYGATILWDVGIAPGLSNMLSAHAYRKMGPLRDLKIWVGGNPTGPWGEWKYMAPFSPSDVIEEYTRPARVIRDGESVVIPALSDRHTVDVDERGEMEAFLTDGLRSLLSSVPCENMSEYTVRWPGHIQKFIDHRDSGGLDEFQLIEEWRYDPKVPEFTWLRVLAEGSDGETMEWTVQDYGGDDGHSMARTTGLVTAICTEAWIEDSKMLPPGVHAPEVLSDEVLSRVIREMVSHGVEITGPDV